MFTFCELDWNENYSIHNPDNKEFELVKYVMKESTTLKRLSEPITKNRIGIHKNRLTKFEKEKIFNLVDNRGLLEEFKKLNGMKNESTDLSLHKKLAIDKGIHPIDWKTFLEHIDFFQKNYTILKSPKF